MKDTVRLITTFKCNFSCSYCCNEQYEFNSLFQYVSLSDVDFDQYRSVCVTGGEPFMNREFLYHEVLPAIPQDKNVYIYTNGVLLFQLDLIWLTTRFPNVKCLNIGVHKIDQLDKIEDWVGKMFPARFMFQDIYEEELLQKYPERLNKNNIKPWVMNQCDMPNEDWMVLK